MITWSSVYPDVRSARQARQAPLWAGALKAGLQRSKEEGGSCAHLNFMAKSTFFFKTQN